MSNEIKPVNPGHGDYERRDIGVAAVLYFLAGLAIAMLLVYFVANGIFWYLEKRFEAQQKPVSPLVTNAPSDTRRIPAQFNEDYAQYLKQDFPAPQLEINERTELNDERLREENTLNTYDYVDKNAGIVRIPIDRAMDLLAEKGLPVRNQSSGAEATAGQSPAAKNAKGSK